MSCKWAIPGKLDWQCGINRTLCYGALLFAQKSESAKECVTTHLPNEVALKMDGAKANNLYIANTIRIVWC